MTDDLDIRLRTSLRAVALPRAPLRLQDALERLPLDVPAEQPRGLGRLRPIGLLAAGLAAVALVAIALALSTGPRGVGPIGPTPSPSPSVSVAPSATPRPSDATFPLTIVSVLLEDRAAGRIGGEQFVVSGFWTDRRGDDACPSEPPSPLLACGDGQFGLTDEPDSGTGPDLTPYVPPAVLASAPYGALLARLAQPVNVMLLGHFDDPAADACPPAARQACVDRFVVDELYFVEDPESPAPTVDPSPGPFPFASPPPAPFTTATCENVWTGDQATDPRPEITVLGWIASGELELDHEPFVPLPEAVYAIVTTNEVPLTLWVDDAETGERVRRWGMGVCYGWEHSGTFYGALPGTAWKVWEDGRREKVDSVLELESPAP